jgi:alcohol dehydrogenase (NADP+)
MAWGLSDYNKKFEPMWINRPKVGDFDVKVDLHYCGICHSDVHLALNHLGTCMYPIVPGHELIGKVVEIGSKVTKV